MIILSIETSCDETAAAVVQKSGDRITILSNIVASSAALQAKYGGVIPEQAAREQIKSIIPVIEEALRLASLAQGKHSLDAIAVTYGPGLIGSLLVGMETAKTLALVWDKPLIPVNHLLGHFYANWISEESSKKKSRLSTLATSDLPTFPCIGLLVSGGHTDLVFFEDHDKYEYLGGTRDDAAGECFDKCARLLGLPYPGGPSIAAEAAKITDPAPQAKRGEQNLKFKIELPRPMINSKNFDFSFSGLKTAVANVLQGHSLSTQGVTLTNSPKAKQNLAAAIQQAIVDVLVTKTVRAAQTFKVDQIIVAGGVAANQKLKESLESRIKSQGRKIKLFVPPPELCTDNAAMIASAAFFQQPLKDPLSLQADPNLSL